MLNTKAGEIYNIGSNVGISHHDLAKKISANFNHSIEIKTNKSLIGEIKTDSLLPNINRAYDHFELEIYTQIDEAIKRTIDWYLI